MILVESWAPLVMILVAHTIWQWATGLPPKCSTAVTVTLQTNIPFLYLLTWESDKIYIFGGAV